MSARPKILHVNDIAGVGRTLVREARLEGKPWALTTLPPGRGSAINVLRGRLSHALTWDQVRHDADLIDIHFATNGFYAWGRTPFVCHVHGTDIRRDWSSRILGPVITRTLRHAAAVVCATPDLLDWVRPVRPDAVWLPNPIPHPFLTPPEVDVQPGRVLMSSRWDDTKGIDVLLPLARLLVERGVDVVGVDWGKDAPLAAEAGVRLLPRMVACDFAQLIGSADLVVGQLKYPVLSMTDYQTLIAGRPLVAAASIEDAPVIAVDIDGRDHASPSALPRDPEVLADVITEVLDHRGDWSDTVSAPSALRQWALDTHHPQACVAALEELYHRILS